MALSAGQDTDLHNLQGLYTDSPHRWFHLYLPYRVPLVSEDLPDLWAPRVLPVNRAGMVSLECQDPR